MQGFYFLQDPEPSRFPVRHNDPPRTGVSAKMSGSKAEGGCVIDMSTQSSSHRGHAALVSLSLSSQDSEGRSS